MTTTLTQTEPRQQTETRRKKILIVEDDKSISMALAIRLKSCGYETTIASDTVTGLESALKVGPDLVLLDVSLPAGNGFMVAERIQRLIPAPTPIIFLTASTQPGLREKAQEVGAVAFFKKPYDAEELCEAIRLTLAGLPVEDERRVYQL